MFPCGVWFAKLPQNQQTMSSFDESLISPKDLDVDETSPNTLIRKYISNEYVF